VRHDQRDRIPFLASGIRIEGGIRLPLVQLDLLRVLVLELALGRVPRNVGAAFVPRLGLDGEGLRNSSGLKDCGAKKFELFMMTTSPRFFATRENASACIG